jgi:hypothetical protein
MPDRAIGLLDRLYNPGLQATLGVTSDAPEGDFTFSSAVPVEKLADLYKENTLEDVLTRQEEKQGLDLLAMILNALRPQFTTESAGFEEIGGGEKFPPSTALRSDRFNNGGIVQGFFRGGSADRIRSAADNFSSNISGNVSGRDAQSDQRLADIDLSNYGGTRNPKQQTFELIKEIENMNPVERAVGNFVGGKMLGYETDKEGQLTPTGLSMFREDTQRTKDINDRLAQQSRLDDERAERKLAEEQRLRDMIAGMMPKTAATPAPPMVTAPDAPTATPATPDYSSVVVPSDRVPGFDVGNISPFPQFRMPTEFSPVFPSSLSADYFRDLFKNIGVNKMQEGGAVNQLDSAIDNFINTYR